MRKLLFLISILFSASNFCSAQVTFQKAYGGTHTDAGKVVLQTTDGGYIIAGGIYYSSPVLYGDKAYLIKTNLNGDLLWTKTFISPTGSGSLSIGVSDAQPTNDGGYVLLGTILFKGQKTFLIKTDAAGDTLWARQLNENGMDQNFGFSVQQTSDSGFIIAGKESLTFNTEDVSTNANLVKINKYGEVIWSKSYGGSKFDVALSVQQTNDHGYIFTGYTRSFGIDSTDVYLVKTNADGDTLWTRTFGGPLADIGYAVKQTSDNGYIIVGSTSSFGAKYNDAYLVKTNSDGYILWSKTYSAPASDNDYNIQLTADGGYIICGNSFGTYDVFLLKTDKSGNMEWSKTITGSGSNITLASDGGYVITGVVFSGNGNGDVMLLKTDKMGNISCNETDAATITNTPATKMSGTSTIVVQTSFSTASEPFLIGSEGTETTLCTSVGLNEIKSSLPLLISPNPSAGDFVITFPGIINQGTVEVYTVMGERIFNKAVSLTSNLEINLKNSSPGIYFVKVMDGERRYSQKIMIQR